MGEKLKFTHIDLNDIGVIVELYESLQVTQSKTLSQLLVRNSSLHSQMIESNIGQFQWKDHLHGKVNRFWKKVKEAAHVTALSAGKDAKTLKT